MRNDRKSYGRNIYGEPVDMFGDPIDDYGFGFRRNREPKVDLGDLTLSTTLEDAKAEAMKNYEQFKDQNTIYSSEVPWTKLGNIGIYEFSVRYYKMFNQKSYWGYSYYCGGGSADGKFDTMEEAINAGVISATEKLAELDRNIEESDRKRDERDQAK